MRVAPAERGCQSFLGKPGLRTTDEGRRIAIPASGAEQESFAVENPSFHGDRGNFSAKSVRSMTCAENPHFQGVTTAYIQRTLTIIATISFLRSHCFQRLGQKLFACD